MASPVEQTFNWASSISAQRGTHTKWDLWLLKSGRFKPSSASLFHGANLGGGLLGGELPCDDLLKALPSPLQV